MTTQTIRSIQLALIPSLIFSFLYSGTTTEAIGYLLRGGIYYSYISLIFLPIVWAIFSAGTYYWLCTAKQSKAGMALFGPCFFFAALLPIYDQSASFWHIFPWYILVIFPFTINSLIMIIYLKICSRFKE